MYTEDDLLPLSALQHLVFCERQCCLVHLEQVWRDNSLTLEGSHLHERAHESGPRREIRGDTVICRGVPLRSFRLGVSGVADVVEFHRVSMVAVTQVQASRDREGGIELSGLPGLWRPFPVEYKRGRPKWDLSDVVQLCAQAMCLEEMLGVAVPAAALFYGALQRRHPVELTDELRRATERAAARLRELLESGKTPSARRQPKCKRCSLLEICRPDVGGSRRSARRYLASAISAAMEEEGSGS